MPCAVYGTEPAKTIVVRVYERTADVDTTVHEVEGQLGYRALDRLLQKIQAGVNPPAKRKGKSNG